jgi:hypothetical protein
LHQSRHFVDRQPEGAGTPVGLPEAEHNDVQLLMPRNAHGASGTALVEKNLTAARERYDLTGLHELTVAA